MTLLYWIAGIVAGLLLAYLFAALLITEKFE